MYTKARSTALTTSNICSGWRSTGLWPLSPITVLDKVPESDDHVPQQPHTPPQQPQDLDLTVLTSSPPNGTELRIANRVFNSTVEASDMPTPAKRYSKRMISLVESKILN